MKNSLFIIILLFANSFSYGQSLDTLRGLIKDSTGNPIVGANVWAYVGNDTLHAVSNEHGKVKFLVAFSRSINVKATSLGFESASQVVSYGTSSFDVMLKEKTSTLKEVVIRGIVNPVSVKEDTVEYDVSHFMHSHDDVIQDLLARLPGLQINSDGSISMMGQKISKIMINGQEFIVSDITTLTNIIPANLINKIQLIDDYGAQNQLTGRKISESQKVINLTTINKNADFYLGRAAVAKGSQDLYALYSNLFRYSNQQSINLLLSNDNIGINVGKTKNSKGELSFRKTLNKKFSINTGLSYKQNSTGITSESKFQTITSEGILFNNLNSNGINKIRNFVPKIEILYKNDEKDQVKFDVNGSLQQMNNNNQVLNLQSGFQKKDQLINNENIYRQNEYEGNLLFSHKFKKDKRVIFFQFSLKNKNSDRGLTTNNKLRFYNKDSSLFFDSLLNQLVTGHNITRDFKGQFSYVEPLNKDISLELNYGYFKTLMNTNLNTSWMNDSGRYISIDSLTNDNIYSIYQHQIQTNLRYKKGAFEYVIGGSIKAFSFGGNRSMSGLPFYPILQFGYNKDNSISFKFNYFGESIFPSFQQLSESPDYSDVQNPVYGNPNLKATQKHIISIDFFKAAKWNTFMFKFSGIILNNNIVNNNILVEDVLGTVKQETHFMNSNGNYQFENQNSWTKHFKNEKGEYQLQIGGNYIQNILYYNSMRNISRNLMLLSKVGINYKPSIFSLSLNALYTFSQNNYSIYNNSITGHSINLYSYDVISFSDNFKCEIVGSKQFNYGFGSGLNSNSLMIDLKIYKWLLKKRIITVLECNNLLDQGAQITQSVTNNVISASVFNHRVRYFLLKVMFDIKSIKM